MRIEVKKNFELIQPFGPSILRVKIPEEVLKKLNDYIDNIISNNEQIDKLNHGHNLVGDVTQEFKLDLSFITDSGWLKFLGESVQEWIKLTMHHNIKKFKLIDSWVVRQFKNEYNPIHWHNGHISGAGFLKVPSTLGKHVQNNKFNKTYVGGNLNLVHGSKQFMSNSKFSIVPKVGDFYFFPHYLMHTVYPFKGTNEERRSISFNANIDEEIFNA